MDKTLKVTCVLENIDSRIEHSQFYEKFNYLIPPPDVPCDIIKFRVVRNSNNLYLLCAKTKYNNTTLSRSIIQFIVYEFKTLLKKLKINQTKYIFNAQVEKNNKIIGKYTNDEDKKYFKKSIVLTSLGEILFRNEFTQCEFLFSMKKIYSYSISLPEKYNGYSYHIKMRTNKKSWLIDTYLEVTLENNTRVTVRSSKNLDNYPCLKYMLSKIKEVLIKSIINYKI